MLTPELFLILAGMYGRQLDHTIAALEKIAALEERIQRLEKGD